MCPISVTSEMFSTPYGSLILIKPMSIFEGVFISVSLSFYPSITRSEVANVTPQNPAQKCDEILTLTHSFLVDAHTIVNMWFPTRLWWFIHFVLVQNSPHASAMLGCYSRITAIFVAFSKKKFHREWLSYYSVWWVWKWFYKNHYHISQ